MTTRSRWYRKVLVAATLVAAWLTATAFAAGAITWTIGADGVTGDTAIAGTGFQAVDLVNGLDAPQEFDVFHLHDGVSMADFQKGYDAVSQTFSGAVVAAFTKDTADVIGGGVVAPSGTQRVYVDLKPGTYVVNAQEAGSDTPTPHLLIVTVSDGPSATAPAADLELHLADFEFDFPDTLPAGPQLWHVQNTGAQTHHAVLFKLLPGKTQDDLMAWLAAGDAGGPPPAEDGGSVAVVSADQSYYASMDLTPGTYVAVCFMPDATTDQPHAMKGMVQTFTVL